jgi:methyltransferase (TIGR00027 family)
LTNALVRFKIGLITYTILYINIVAVYKRTSVEEGKPSNTAVFAALSRAAHLYFDSEPKILEDYLALRLCGLKSEAELRNALNELCAKFGQLTTTELAQCIMHSMRGLAVIRHRYAEDELLKAVKRGVSQYVILGAGLDSFAYRRQGLEEKLRIFEVDYPATQQWKKTRLKELNIRLPRNLAFVPVDFEKQKLAEELLASGYQQSIPAFYSWLGVTSYLTETVVFQTLGEIASMPPGSEVIFDYALEESLLGDGERRIWDLGRATPGESDKTQFKPADLIKRLKNTGFTSAADFGPEQANSRYLKGRMDQLSVSVLGGLPASIIKLFHIMKAIV